MTLTSRAVGSAHRIAVSSSVPADSAAGVIERLVPILSEAWDRANFLPPTILLTRRVIRAPRGGWDGVAHGSRGQIPEWVLSEFAGCLIVDAEIAGSFSGESWDLGANIRDFGLVALRPKRLPLTAGHTRLDQIHQSSLPRGSRVAVSTGESGAKNFARAAGRADVIRLEDLGFVREQAPDSLYQLNARGDVMITGMVGIGTGTVECAVENPTENVLEVVLPEGALYEVEEAYHGFQNLVAARAERVVLEPGEMQVVRIGTYCAISGHSTPNHTPMRPTPYRLPKAFSSQAETWRVMDARIASLSKR